MLRVFLRVSCGFALIVCLLTCPNVWAGVNYADPAGGWRYTFEADPFPAGIGGMDGDGCVGGVCPPGYGTDNDRDALDGTWQHGQGDKWDGSAPGDPLGDYHVPATVGNPLSGNQGTAPGGAGIFSEGNTSYLRIQDVGNPEDTNPNDNFYNGYVQGNVVDPSGPSKPMNNNRRVYFGHAMAQDGALASEGVLSVTGVTLSFRARIPDISHIAGLDDIHEQDVDQDGDLNITPWFQDLAGQPYSHGRGAPMVNGRGSINVAQNDSGTNVDSSVGFSLVTSNDVATFCDGATGSLCTGSGSGGLIMNNLIGEVPTNVDSTSGGDLNILEMTDSELNQWNEFWITMENNGPTAGNIEVKVYMNGEVSNPDTFQVTLFGNNNAVYSDDDDPFLEMGFSSNAELIASLDIDFLSYTLGVLDPVAALNGGDYNDDGVVNAADYAVWLAHLGASAGTLPNDVDGGVIGQAQYDTLEIKFWIYWSFRDEHSHPRAFYYCSHSVGRLVGNWA